MTPVMSNRAKLRRGAVRLEELPGAGEMRSAAACMRLRGDGCRCGADHEALAADLEHIARLAGHIAEEEAAGHHEHAAAAREELRRGLKARKLTSAGLAEHVRREIRLAVLRPPDVPA
jgi:hypothetical protein